MTTLEVRGAVRSDRFRVGDVQGQLPLRRHILVRRARGEIDLARTSHLDRTQRDPKSSRLLAHRGEAAFVGIGAATQYDRVARLAMEYGIGLSAAYQEQYYDE